MKKRMLNFPIYLVLFSLSVLLLLPNSALAERDGGWTTTSSPGYIFQTQEGLYNNQKHLVLTLIKPDREGVEFYWGPVSGSAGSTYLLAPLNADSDMTATWQFNSVTQATVTVESCTTNCLWVPDQVVTLNKFFGDMKADPKIASRVPKTGQTACWDEDGNPIDCTGTGQDGEYQLGVLPAVPPSFDNPYTVHGWKGVRFTDNLVGTVTDNLTGLIWLKNAGCFGMTTWEQALNNASSLESGKCGLTDSSAPGDWRLPNFNELHSLFDPSTGKSPWLPPGNPFVGFDPYVGLDCWSSTSADVTGLRDWAWFVSFSFGKPYISPKDFDLTAIAWPVRSAW